MDVAPDECLAVTRIVVDSIDVLENSSLACTTRVKFGLSTQRVSVDNAPEIVVKFWRWRVNSFSEEEKEPS